MFPFDDVIMQNVDEIEDYRKSNYTLYIWKLNVLEFLSIYD